MWVAFGVSFVMLIGISCTGIAVRHPHNLIALFLYAALNVLILYAIISWFFPAPSQEMVNIYNGLGALVFSGYIVYDTQLIVGGKHRAYQFGLDDYVVACLNIYLDIVNLFLIILSCGGGNRD